MSGEHHEFKCFSCRNKVKTDKYETKTNKRGRPYYSAQCNGTRKDGQACTGKLARFISNRPKQLPTPKD